MVKKRFILIALVVVVVILVAVTPAILRAIPDRYAVRWLPESLQAVALPETESAVLPTLAPIANVDSLLEATVPPTFTPVLEPSTPTAVPVEDEATAVPTPAGSY